MCDVEGAELLTLKGAKSILKSDSPPFFSKFMTNGLKILAMTRRIYLSFFNLKHPMNLFI